MTKTVVHVTSLNQWKSALDVWFKQGYTWNSGDQEYQEKAFKKGGRYLYLGGYITYDRTNYDSIPFIEYSEFMSKQKEDNKMKTVYVTQDKLDHIQELKERQFPLDGLLTERHRYENIHDGLDEQGEKALLRYLGGDETIELKVKEELYRLWRNDYDGHSVYMNINTFGTPGWIIEEEAAFTAPLEEIKKWQTPAWEIEKVEE